VRQSGPTSGLPFFFNLIRRNVQRTVFFSVCFFFTAFTFGFSLSSSCGVFIALLSAASKRTLASWSEYNSGDLTMAESDYLVVLMEGEQGDLHTHEFLLNGGPINHPETAIPAFLALGHAAAAWGRLEQHIDAILLQVNKEQHSNEILALFDPNHPRPFTDKIKLLKKYFNRHPALTEFKEKIRSFANTAKTLAQERNEYIHGIFERYDPQSKTIFLHGIRPKFDPKNPYLFGIALSGVPLEVLVGFAVIVNKANDELEIISRALFTQAAIERLQKRE
jgi:hypothetical protein